jgi:hypothetical protein
VDVEPGGELAQVGNSAPHQCVTVRLRH